MGVDTETQTRKHEGAAAHQQPHDLQPHARVDKSEPMEVEVDVSLDDIRKSPLLCTQGLINGQWVAGHANKTFPVVDPATLQVLAHVAAMDAADVDCAVGAAVHAQREWKQSSPRMRSELLKNWYQQILVHVDDLAMLTTAESGKPISEARGEVLYAASFVDFFAHACLQSGGFVVPSATQDQRMVAVHEPVGVCAIITPWNFPLAMITRKLAPCLAAGCSAIVRPASETPLTALALAKLAMAAGIPDGVVNVVTSPHENAAQVGKALATCDAIRKISFTGSTRVGQLLMQQAASNVKRLSLELGGDAPFIVFEDADLDAAVAGLMSTKFRNTGQTCVSTNRVFVHNSIFAVFLEKVVKQVEQLTMGSPFSAQTQLGPLINGKTFHKVQTIVQDALDKGASVATGGKPASQYGPHFFAPTVLVDVTKTMRVFTEEMFGPVLPMFPFDTEQEVVALANDTTAGLAGYFYTNDLARAWRVAGALECGMVGVNTGAISNAHAPFGGVKQSGLGREGSMMGLDEYVETKLIAMGGLLP